MNTRRMNGDTLEIFISDNLVMSLSEKLIDGKINIKVSGEILNEVAHEFEDELFAAFSVCKDVKIDLSNVTYIASIALSALLSVQQIIDEREYSTLVISGLSSEIKEIFETSGFFDIFTIEE